MGEWRDHTLAPTHAIMILTRTITLARLSYIWQFLVSERMHTLGVRELKVPDLWLLYPEDRERKS